MNPLLSMMGGAGGSNPMAAMMQAMQVANQIRQTGNPQAALNVMAQQNPNIKKAMDMCQGKNPEQVEMTAAMTCGAAAAGGGSS